MSTAIHRKVDAARRGELPNAVCRVTSGWVILAEAQFMRGYCLLLPDPVVGALNDLTGDARTRYLSDMVRIGDAVTALCQPRRINYEILGNLEPALHAHIIPRYHDEPESLRTKAIWLYPPEAWNDPANQFDPVKHAALLSDLRRRLD